MKILYAASQNQNAKIQLARFLRAMRGTKHQIKIAAYKISSPKSISIDWTLDALLNIYKPEFLTLNNDNLGIYFEQIKSYAPDLIISDLEYFTSYLATLLNIPTWQCSSSLINYALAPEEKYDLGLFKFYAHSLNRESEHNQRIINLIDNASGNFVYSHYGDTEHPPKLQNNFQWIRPYHQVYRLSPVCEHLVVAGLSKNNKRLFDILRKYPDSVIFMDADSEKYENLRVKDIGIEDEYYCNLRNCLHFVCQGQTSFLADAFYNAHFSIIYPDYEDTESIINSHLSAKLQLGVIVSQGLGRTLEMTLPTYDSSIKYLDEKIKELE